jgi:hypothetical protein
MKLVFKDRSYVEIKKSQEPDKVVVIISSRDAERPNVATTNSVEISMKEFQNLISDIK